MTIPESGIKASSPFVRSTDEKYDVIASLGTGGMANIYLSVMSGPGGFNKLLVLKILREDLDVNVAEFQTMFLDEARLAARLQHRNIVQTYEFGELGGRYYMSMEYLDGQPLRAIQRKLLPSGLPVAEELLVLSRTARGLHHAHELAGFDGAPLGVVHRDISPQNVFVTYSGEVKLLDFGIAKNQNAEHLTKVGVIKGKLDYIAPEQIRSESVDRRADVFALGAMMWEAVTKQRFGGGPKVEEVAKFHRRLTGGEPGLREVREDVPDALVTIVERATALAPDDRYATAEEFADAVDAYLETLPQRPSERSLAAILQERFRDERDRLKGVIDERLQQIEVKGRERQRELSLSGARSLELGLTISDMVDLSNTSSTSSSGMQLPPPVPPPPPEPVVSAKAKPGRLAIAAVLAVAAAAAGGLALLGPSDEPVASNTGTEQERAGAGVAATAPGESDDATAQPQEPGAGAPVANAPTITLSVSASPADAHVTLDGAPVPSLPFSGAFRKSQELHHLEASAEGYQAMHRLVSFDEDREIVFSLRPKPAGVVHRPRRPVRRGETGGEIAVAAEPAPAPPKRETQAETAPGAALKAKPKRHDFDMNNPYAD